jgi:hypothetical protein
LKQPITGFQPDDEGHRVARLACGHRRHVRHQPPFNHRPWVTTEAGRVRKIGVELDCPRCDAFEWPDHIVEQAGRRS